MSMLHFSTVSMLDFATVTYQHAEHKHGCCNFKASDDNCDERNYLLPLEKAGSERDGVEGDKASVNIYFVIRRKIRSTS